MRSSFKKVDKTTVSQKCYFGHPDLDAIFFNSLSKGHLMVIQEDRPTTNYLSLLRYFISSNHNEGIKSIIYDATPAKWSRLISPPMKQQLKKQSEQKSQIAWRYDSMQIQLKKLAIDDKISHIDLSKEAVVQPNLLRTHSFPTGQPRQFYLDIESEFLNAHDNEKDTSSIKLLLSSLPSYFYNHDEFSQFLHAVKCLTRSSHLFTVITVPAIIGEEVSKKLLRYADYYIQIGKVSKGYEDFCATMTILKDIESCTVRSRFRGQSVWGIKQKKRQLQIDSLYENPFSAGNKNEQHDF